MSNSPREDASRAFFEKRHGSWSAQDQAVLEARLGADPLFEQAYQVLEQSWSALGAHAEAPEIVAFREQALADMRITNERRWSPNRQSSRVRLAAGFCGMALLLAVAWQISPYGFRPGQYQTQVGELRMLELDDRSRIAIDSATKLRVHFTHDARTVRLVEGQAQFSVAHDPARPFKVDVGDRTIVALGTAFTVEYTDRELRVAMLEGKVAVVPRLSAEESKNERASPGGGKSDPALTETSGKRVELTRGEALSVAPDGKTTFLPNADIEAAMAWREGRVILRGVKLGDAVRKMNRYSTVKLRVADPSLEQEHISGVFEAGNSQGFIDDLKQILAIDAGNVDSGTIELRRQ